MTQQSDTASGIKAVATVSWLPLAIIMLAQIQMAFNVNALPVSIGPIVDDLNTPATSVATALVIYSLFVAAFVMLGAKIGKIMGDRLVFQISALVHGLAMGIMALSPSTVTMNVSQAIAGLAAAVLVPTLVVMIAANYHDKQQEQALGILAGTPAMAGAVAFFVAGFLATAFSWRVSFGMLTIVSVIVFLLSFRLKPIPRKTGIEIDFVGAVLVAIAIIMISFGFNNLNSWGLIVARTSAPFDILGLSPAPIMIIIGVVVGQAFFFWIFKRESSGKSPLMPLELLNSTHERAATYTMLAIGVLGPAVNFLIPLYIQIVQGRTSLQTAIAVVPYTLAIVASAVLVVRLYDRFSPRQIGSTAFTIAFVGLTLLAFTIQNGWGTPIVILGLVILGLGEGGLLTLAFNVLVSSSPKEMAGDVGALRGVVNNLSNALGTAIAGVLAVSLLSLIIATSLVDNQYFPPAIQEQLNLDNVEFINNDQLLEVLSNTTATPDEVQEAIRINEDARLRALKISFLILAGVALLAIFPALRLPRYVPEEIPETI